MSMVFNLRRHQPRARRALIELSATGVFKEIEFQLAEPLLIKAASRMSNLPTSFTVLSSSRFTHSSCHLQLRVSQDRGASSGMLRYGGSHGRSARYVPKIN